MPSPFKYELLELSNTHSAIADWLIANPGKGQLGRCAAVFGYTQAWLSTLIHQDAFQAMLKHKQGLAFEQVVIPLHEKLSGIAHRGVEKLGEIIEETKDERLVREITKDSLQALGYGANTKGPSVFIDQSTHNSLTVNSDALAEARQRRSQHFGSHILESTSKPSDPIPETETAQLPDHQEPAVGETRDLRPEHVNVSAPFHGDEEAGS
jgi:hypothetical protein